jgi:hypothetical protein
MEENRNEMIQSLQGYDYIGDSHFGRLKGFKKEPPFEKSTLQASASAGGRDDSPDHSTLMRKWVSGVSTSEPSVLTLQQQFWAPPFSFAPRVLYCTRTTTPATSVAGGSDKRRQVLK